MNVMVKRKPFIFRIQAHARRRAHIEAERVVGEAFVAWLEQGGKPVVMSGPSEKPAAAERPS